MQSPDTRKIDPERLQEALKRIDERAAMAKTELLCLMARQERQDAQSIRIGTICNQLRSRYRITWEALAKALGVSAIMLRKASSRERFFSFELGCRILDNLEKISFLADSKILPVPEYEKQMLELWLNAPSSFTMESDT